LEINIFKKYFFLLLNIMCDLNKSCHAGEAIVADEDLLAGMQAILIDRGASGMEQEKGKKKITTGQSG